jgi:multicomponent Na+:H+ antiporter subunit C
MTVLTSAGLFGLCGALLVAIGLWGLVARRHLLRRFLAFNVIGSGIFLVFGAAAARRPDLGTDAVPQALIITGIVVAFAASALAVALVVRLALLTGQSRLPAEGEDEA